MFVQKKKIKIKIKNKKTKGGYLPSSLHGQSFDGIVHVTDWFPTIVGIAGATKYITDDLDGEDLWDDLNKLNGGRNEIAYITNWDTADNECILCFVRVGNYKLVVNGAPETTQA